MKKYDAILVHGRGIFEDGSMPESAYVSVQKAVELWKEGIANYIIFSGKWTYKLFEYIPPKTEARAMAEYAETLGFDIEKAILEEESETTVHNLLNVKMKILLPRGWKRVAIISIPVFEARMKINTDMVFGKDITYDFFSCGLHFPKDREKAYEELEQKKINGEVKKTYEGLIPGDHEAILKKTNAELAEKKRQFNHN